MIHSPDQRAETKSGPDHSCLENYFSKQTIFLSWCDKSKLYATLNVIELDQSIKKLVIEKYYSFRTL